MRPASAAVGLWVGLWALSASASGFMISKMGGDLSGPTEPNPAAVFWNPAALGPIDGASLILDFNFAWRTLDFERSWTDEAIRDDRPDNPGRMEAFDTLPLAAFTVRPGIDWLTVGIGVYVPFGHRSDFPPYDLEAEKELPEDQRRPIPPQAFHDLKGGFKTIYTTPSLAVRPLTFWGVDWLWLGLGVSWIHAELDLTRLKDFAPEINELLGFDFARPEQMATSGTARLDFAGNAWGFAVGLYAQPWEFLRLGLSWTSGSKLVLPGSVRLHLPELVAATFGSEALVRSSATLHMDLPPALRAGVHWDITRWLVFRVSLEYVHWELFRDIRIHELDFRDSQGDVAGLDETTEFIDPRHYENAVDVRAGFRVFLLPWWMLFVGGGYDTNAAPDAYVTPDLYDAAKLGLAGGTWIQLVPLIETVFDTELDRDDRLALAVGFNWIHYLPRTVSGSRTEPPIDGRYRSEVFLLNTNLEARF